MGPVKHPAFTMHDPYEHLVRSKLMTGRTVERPVFLVAATGAAKLRHSSIVQVFERSSTSYERHIIDRRLRLLSPSALAGELSRGTVVAAQRG